MKPLRFTPPVRRIQGLFIIAVLPSWLFSFGKTAYAAEPRCSSRKNKHIHTKMRLKTA